MNKKIKTVTETVGDMERFPCKKINFTQVSLVLERLN